MPVFNPFDSDSMPEPPDLDDAPVNRSFSAGKNSAAEQGVEIPMDWKPTPKAPVPVVRCTARSTTSGERCKRWSIRGLTVCQSHGGRLPNLVEHSQAVVESARMRLFGMVDDAVDGLDELIQQGTSPAIRLKAIEMVLNRTGLKDAVEVNVEVNHNVSASEEINKKLSMIRERLTPQPIEEFVEAEEVEDANEV